jgi:DNA-binding GntR family transcriptional regulator
MTSDQLKVTSLDQEVYDRLRAAILQGEFEPGEPMVEARLSARFGISKTPVREALIRLQRDGLVESVPHRRTRVATPTEDDIQQACDLRMWIETTIAARCAADPRPELLAALEASIADADRALATDDEAVYLEAIRGFSDLLIEEVHNRYAVETLDRLRNVLGLIATISRSSPGRRQRSVEEHRAILQALRDRDPAAAAEATRRHIESIERDSVAALRGRRGAA